MDGSEARHRSLGERLHRLRVPHVGHDGFDHRPGGTQTLGLGFQPLAVDVGQHQMSARFGQCSGDAEADPARRAGDHRHSMAQHVHCDATRGLLQPATMWVVKRCPAARWICRSGAGIGYWLFIVR
jgi:hypothetical protein